MHLLPSLICITVICVLCFQYVRPASVCHCIRIKDCGPFVQRLLNHTPAERASVFAMVHSAGCGFQGLDPLACCPPQQQGSSRNSRWVWDTPSSSKRSTRFNNDYNRFEAYETEMHLHEYRDFNSQLNCPQPLDEEYDDDHHLHHQQFGFPGHHYHYHVDHEVKPRPKPANRPIVFPGDLRFHHSIETKGNGKLMADDSQEQAMPEDSTTTTAASTTSTAAPPAVRMNDPDCGISLTTRISGGQQVVPGQYPWLARIAYRNRTSNRISYRCSGSLISNNYIVTAAHCVINLVSDLELFRVRIGDDSSSEQDCSPTASNCSRPNLFDIGRVLVHPNYDQPKYANDIALLSLNNSRGQIMPICLPLNNTATLADRLIGQIGVVAGWSTTAENNSLASSGSTTSSTSVRFIRLPIVNTTSCAITYATLSENFQQPIVITPRHLCAQGQHMNDVCRGDSGGPFMDDGTSGLLNANGRYTLLGIVAFGPTLCGVTTIPGVYTAVSSYMKWIFDSISSVTQMSTLNVL
ncbi:melanization protease 1 [Drosophila grimshawi]|uniref:melanization protease 1 n=1 Tax=Drosophila grimshawi TaxID=7222 RepID=UPI0013EF16A2|nr:melanization protease 1 [Drosophila grimshawi]